MVAETDASDILQKEARQRKLEFVYGHALHLLTHEGTLLASRIGHSVTTQAILFSAFFLISNNIVEEDLRRLVIKLLICACGVAFLISYTLLFARNLDSADFWRSRLISIELDDDFWNSTSKDSCQGLDIITAASRRFSSRESGGRASDKEAKKSSSNKVLTSLSKIVKDPIYFFGIQFPIVFILAWIFLACLSIRPAIHHDLTSPLHYG